MKNVKFAVLGLGVLGLIACFLPFISEHGMSISFWKLGDLLKEMGGSKSQIYITMSGFVIAAVMGGMAAAKPPMQRWQGIVAAIGFAFVLFKLRGGMGLGKDSGYMDILKHGAIGAKLMCLVPIAGIIASILPVAKPEQA